MAKEWSFAEIAERGALLIKTAVYQADAKVPPPEGTVIKLTSLS
jgi:hypothetical protein